MACDATATPLIYGSFLNNYLKIGGSIYPWSSNTYDLGSSTLPWRHGYFGESSVYLGDYQVTKAKAQGWDAAVNASAVTNIVNSFILGSGKVYMTEVGSTSVLYHVTSGNHTNKIGEFYTP